MTNLKSGKLKRPMTVLDPSAMQCIKGGGGGGYGDPPPPPGGDD